MQGEAGVRHKSGVISAKRLHEKPGAKSKLLRQIGLYGSGNQIRPTLTCKSGDMVDILGAFLSYAHNA